MRVSMTNNGATVGYLRAFITIRLRACGLKSNLSRRATTGELKRGEIALLSLLEMAGVGLEDFTKSLVKLGLGSEFR